MSRGPVAVFNYPLPDEIYFADSSSSRHRRGTTPSSSHRSSAPRYIPTPTIDPRKLTKQFPASPPYMDESFNHHFSSARVYSSDDRRESSSGTTNSRKRSAPIVHQREHREPEFDERLYGRESRRQTLSSVPSRHYSSNDDHSNNNYYYTSPTPAPYTLMSSISNSRNNTTFPPSPPTSPGSMSSSSPFFSSHYSPMSPSHSHSPGNNNNNNNGSGTIPLTSTTTTGSGNRYYCQHTDCIDPETNTPRKSFSRRADLQRHHASTHEEIRYSCSKPNCTRKGDNGFTRHDHLVEHRRGFHKEDLPKRNRGSG